MQCIDINYTISINFSISQKKGIFQSFTLGLVRFSEIILANSVKISLNLWLGLNCRIKTNEF